MAISDVLASLLDNWPRLLATLAPDTIELLRGLIVRLDDVHGAEARNRQAQAIAGLLMRELPPGDPVRDSLDTIRLATSPSSARGLASQLRLLAAGTDDRSPEERILSCDWVSAYDMRGTGRNPDLPALIRLDHPDGSYAVPTFQFGLDFAPHEVVLQVNRLLDAEHDPWAAADWWLTPNYWLEDAPADLIDRCPDDDLVAAAAAAVAG